MGSKEKRELLRVTANDLTGVILFFQSQETWLGANKYWFDSGKVSTGKDELDNNIPMNKFLGFFSRGKLDPASRQHIWITGESKRLMKSRGKFASNTGVQGSPTRE